MVEVVYTEDFKRSIQKLDNSIRGKVIKQITKIIEDPETGKPMRFDKKGTRELYVSPFRLSYSYDKNLNLIQFLGFYHKDEQ
jgi:addiction module RelE/StbE family toxin